MFRELRHIQALMVRACMRHMMLFATFPYHVAQEMRGNGPWDASERRTQLVRHRYEDHGWLR
jgi:hypothetical protein